MTTPADTLPTTLYDAGAHAGAVAHICTLLAEGRHTLQACCAAAAIAEDDFRAWAAAPGPVQALYLAARHTADHRFLADALLAARTGLLRLLNPTELDEDETVETTFDKEGRPTGEKRKRSRTRCAPHPATVAYALGALLGGQFGKQTRVPEAHATLPATDPFAHLSVEEMETLVGG